jgi:phage protein D
VSQVFAPQLTVTVGGRPLPRAAEKCIDEVLVEDHLHLPAMFALRFRTDDDGVPTEAGLRVGSTVAISLRSGAAGATTLLEAEVTGIEATLGSFGSHLVVRGYDTAHRLHRAPATKGWNNVTDSDIAAKIAQSHGLPVGQIDSTSIVHTHLAQLNATDWEFLRARAREIGYEVSVRGGRLDFVKATTTVSGRRLALTMGEQLLAFAPRISSATQVKDTRVRSWDPRTKAAIVGSAPAKTGSARLSTTPETLASHFGSPTHVTVDRPVATQSEADITAHAVADSLGSTFVEAEGVARGDPGLRAGTVVKIEGSGRSFDGEYTLTSTRHVWDTDEGYLTHLVISGRHDRSLLGLATLGASAGPHSGGGPPIHGMVVGVVTNAQDPDSLARVKVKFPWLSD